MDQGVGREVKRLREERNWSQAKLAVEADMSVSGVSMIESGQRNLTTTTLAKLADALDVGVADLFPKKAQAPLPFESEATGPSDVERRLLQWPEAVGEWIVSRWEKYERDFEDPTSPYFKTATTAANWLADFKEETAAYQEWILKHSELLKPPGSQEGWRALFDTDLWIAAWETLGPLLPAFDLQERVEQHIAEMNDKPDELAARRLEKANAEAQEGRERLEEWRRAADG